MLPKCFSKRADMDVDPSDFTLVPRQRLRSRVKMHMDYSSTTP